MPRVRKEKVLTDRPLRPRSPRQPNPAPAETAAVDVPTTPPQTPTPEVRFKMIQVAAYFRAEKDGFRKDPAEYWREAELEIALRFP